MKPLRRHSSAKLHALVLASSIGFGGLAVAQRNLDELYDAGGFRLSKTQVTRLVPGTTWLTTPDPGEISYNTDGTFTGYVANTALPGGRGFFGTWRTDEDGRLCQEYEAIRTTGEPFCRYWFKLGDRFFASQSMSDRSATIFPRLSQSPAALIAASALTPEANPFKGTWGVQYVNAQGLAREGLAVFGDQIGTWQMSFESATSLCVGKLTALTIKRFSATEIEFDINRSKLHPECKDWTLKFTSVDTNTLQGKLGEGIDIRLVRK